MNKRTILPIFLLITGLLLTACSGQAQATSPSNQADSAAQTGDNAEAATPQPGGQPADRQQPPDMADQPVESRLAIGILALEDTELAVTTDQATQLLPLWKAVKSLSGSETISEDEMNALYDQIKENLTSEQVSAIEDMKLKPDEMSALMEKYSITMPERGAEMTEEQRATMQAQFEANGGAPEGGMMPGGDGAPQGGFPGGEGAPEGGFPGGEGQNGERPQFEGTQPAGDMPGGRMGGGMNNMFIDPLIELLSARAAS